MHIINLGIVQLELIDGEDGGRFRIPHVAVDIKRPLATLDVEASGHRQ
jgi:hypothetical protein